MENGEHLLEQPLVDIEAKNNSQALSLKEGNTSFFETVFNGINAILGSGVLLLPYALASGGWLSLFLLFVVSASATYTGILVKRCMEVDPSIKTYSSIGEFAFGSIGKIMVSIVLYVDLYMVDTGFLILEGDNLYNLFPNAGISLFGMSIDGKSSLIIITALILLPTVWLDNLSILAYISATGVLASFLILGSVFWVGAFDGVGFLSKGELLIWKGIPTAISLYMLSYSSHPVIPALYTSMKNKRQFSNVLLLCFSLSTALYISIAVLGYLMFGSRVESQITLNLPLEKISSQIAIYTTLITPLAKYALILKPVVITTESWFPIEYQNKKYFKIIIRTGLVATQVVVALALPFFGYLMSLSGALLSATASLTIPCLCYLKISSINSQGSRLVEQVFIWGIVILSMVIVIFGTCTSLVDIVREITH